MWTKKSDWLPVSNALAQVQFWQGDLMQAEQYLQYVRTFRKYNLPGYKWTLTKAIRDVALSKRELLKAKLKLKRTYQRVNRG